MSKVPRFKMPAGKPEVLVPLAMELKKVIRVEDKNVITFLSKFRAFRAVSYEDTPIP
jgi:hypothetical protein